jgi:rhodanese-related sulfurtransferase
MNGGEIMIGKIVCSALALLALTAAVDGAAAQDLDINRATLAEPNQKTSEVSTEQLRRILADRSAMVIDTRSRGEFEAGHIPGARMLDAAPGDHVKTVERMVQGDKAAALVLYCNGPYCQASRRLAEQLVAAGFTNVRRYQLGMPVWRALGGPTAIEVGGFLRVYKVDLTAVIFDGRAAGEFAKNNLAGTLNVPADDVVSGKLKKLPLPEDDFNRRIVLLGREAAQACALANVLRTRPWHNVSYVAGSYEALAAAVQAK